MSSFKKAMKTQNVHKERHQPASRSKLGALEKKKDYIKRARDQQLKKNVLKALHRKALNKNPDEFNFHMYNSQMKHGVHYEKAADIQLSLENVNQDLVYITNRRTVEKNKIEKLMTVSHQIEEDESGNAVRPNTHTIFVDTEKEANGDIADIMDTDKSLIGSTNRLRKSQLAKIDIDPANLQNISKGQKKRYTELHRRIDREHKLAVIQEKLSVRKKIMTTKKMRPKLIKEGDNMSAPIYKWPLVRKP